MALHAYALTTQARAENFLGISAQTGASQTTLITIINSVTDYIEHYCDRRFKQTAYTNELYDGTGADTLNLKNYPVASAETFTISVRDSALNEDDWSNIDTEDYVVDYNAGIVRSMVGSFILAPSRYRVSYTAGYDFDNATTFLSDTAAADVEFAALSLISGAWNRRKGGAGVERESIGDYSVTYMKTIFEDESIKNILDKYARMSLGSYMTPSQY